MILDDLENIYIKNKKVINTIAGISLGVVASMWAYGKYKKHKLNNNKEELKKEELENEEGDKDNG